MSDGTDIRGQPEQLTARAQRKRWAWRAPWLPMIANLGYTFTFGLHDHSVLARSLIADIALPVLLLAHIPAFFRPRPAPARS